MPDYAYGGPNWEPAQDSFTVPTGEVEEVITLGWLGIVDEETRLSKGIKEIVWDTPEEVPLGQQISGWELVDVAGSPHYVPTLEAAALPSQVPMYKVRKWLIINGLKAAVENVLDGLPEPNRSLALEDWEYAPNFVVQSPLSLGVKAALGWTDEQYETAVWGAFGVP